MGARARLIAAIAALTAGAASPALSITVTVDVDSTYQTIEGFGGCSWSCGDDHQWEDVVTDLGATVVRLRSHIGFSDIQVPVVNTVKQLRIDYPVKFIASFWTPPATMKVNGSINGSGLDCSDAATCTNTLKEDAIPAWAAYCADYVKRIKEQTGVDLYGFSFQNEPAFNEPYSSCVYTADKYARTLKAVAAEFDKENIPALIFGAEDMAHNATSNSVTGYANLIKNDSEALAALDRFAVHGYTNGVDPQDVSSGFMAWHQVGAAAGVWLGGKPVWQTETSGFGLDWEGALALGISIMQALKYAKASMWTFWTFTNCKGSDDVFELFDNRKTKRYYVSKNYYRYIRPEAVMVSCNTEEEAAKERSPAVMSAAFVHAQQQTITLVLINTTSSTQDVQFSGTPLPPSFARYETSSSRNCAGIGTLDPADGITLPAKSVTTLVAQDFTVGTTHPSTHSVRVFATNKAARLFALDGRKIEGDVSGAQVLLRVEHGRTTRSVLGSTRMSTRR